MCSFSDDYRERHAHYRRWSVKGDGNVLQLEVDFFSRASKTLYFYVAILEFVRILYSPIYRFASKIFYGHHSMLLLPFKNNESCVDLTDNFKL